MAVTKSNERTKYELANAIELNRPNQMMVVVDVDNREEVDLYTAAGFVKLEGHNSMTAYIPRLISGLD
jgi:3,4-dihydroxy-2-butanone 4-phosphate synthase